jgi:hypothetical protein
MLSGELILLLNLMLLVLNAHHGYPYLYPSIEILCFAVPGRSTSFRQIYSTIDKDTPSSITPKKSYMYVLNFRTYEKANCGKLFLNMPQVSSSDIQNERKDYEQYLLLKTKRLEAYCNIPGRV